MSSDKIFLGRIDNRKIYITRHKWDCSWYWSFGYLGNAHEHFHIESMLDGKTQVLEHFTTTWLTQDQWWVIRDLFITAYAMKNCAAVYAYGGHQSGTAAQYRVISPAMAQNINTDLECVLNTIWELLTEWSNAR